MQISINLILALLLSCFTLVSCGVEDEIDVIPEIIPDCEISVSYYSSNACSDLPTAAAVSLSDSSLLIVSNFFDFADSTMIMENDIFGIGYDSVDSTLFNSGALCGVAIVAPVVEITCFTEN